ncbi:uncharacterized protein ACWYII_018467 [Salvelinus alpinus]
MKRTRHHEASDSNPSYYCPDDTDRFINDRLSQSTPPHKIACCSCSRDVQFAAKNAASKRPASGLSSASCRHDLAVSIPMNVGKYPASNIHLSAATAFTGSSFVQIQKMHEMQRDLALNTTTQHIHNKMDWRCFCQTAASGV